MSVLNLQAAPFQGMEEYSHGRIRRVVRRFQRWLSNGKRWFLSRQLNKDIDVTYLIGSGRLFQIFRVDAMKARPTDRLYCLGEQVRVERMKSPVWGVLLNEIIQIESFVPCMSTFLTRQINFCKKYTK